jgi:hypothetical protein
MLEAKQILVPGYDRTVPPGQKPHREQLAGVTRAGYLLRLAGERRRPKADRPQPVQARHPMS